MAPISGPEMNGYERREGHVDKGEREYVCVKLVPHQLDSKALVHGGVSV